LFKNKKSSVLFSSIDTRTLRHCASTRHRQKIKVM
jgi:hypothetical protein